MPTLIDGKDALVGQLRGDKYLDLAADYGWDIVAGTATWPSSPASMPTLALIVLSELLARSGHGGISWGVDVLAIAAWWFTRPLRR